MPRCTRFVLSVFSLFLVFCQDESGARRHVKVSDFDGGVSTDALYTCPEGFVESNGACCPEILPQRCGDICWSTDCECVSEYNICVPSGWQYCGAGIACPAGENCVADGETFQCVSPDETYCGDSVSCDAVVEECVSDDSGTYCISENWEFCGGGRSCSPREHCAGAVVGCCPDEQIACGKDRCCFEGEECAEEGIACVPRGGHWCNGEICPAGYNCATDGLPLCVPDVADYCGGGRFCTTGVCASDGGCCPLGLPERCGSACCSEDDECVASPWGDVCLSAGVTACGPGSSCDPDEFCAREGLCLPVGAEFCSDGHWCPPGLNCSGPTCCGESTTTFCGDLCCPSGWQCISGGITCIPPGAEFCPETGIWCGPSSHCSDTSGQCITIGWQECGSGLVCAPDQVCATEGTNSQCCPASQPTLCGNICCGVEFQCVHAPDRDFCIPFGATYCDGRSEQEWCPIGTRCGRRLCVPVWLDECADGNYCPSRYECTESNPPCCPVGETTACDGQCCFTGAVCCGNQCCPSDATCITFNGEPYCLLPDTEVCDSVMGQSLCPVGATCERDGFCADSSLVGQYYEYCGGGETCLDDRTCQGMCSAECCEADRELDTSDITECVSSVFARGAGVYCSEDVDFVRCCTRFSVFESMINIERNIGQIESCGIGRGLELECEYNATLRQLCCQNPKPKTVGCLRGCIPKNQLCYDQLISNSPDAYQTAIETSITPDQVPYGVCDGPEIADTIGDFLPIGVFPITDVDFNFHPAGFDECYENGVYHVEWDSDIGNWVNRRNSGITLQRGDEVLVAEAFWAVDALEGICFLHGPYAQLRATVFSVNHFSDINHVTPYEAHNGYIDQRFLKGPLSGDCTWEICVCMLKIIWCVYEECSCGEGFGGTGAEQEWVSGLFMRYTPGWGGLHKWADSETDIYFAIMESDGGYPEYREDDYMGFELINREATKRACGVWVPLYRYDPEGGEDDPPYYYRTDQLAGEILFRTITCTGRTEDPC